MVLQVKVAILRNGEEKANIIFDVRNSGKNDWFRPENVISSTFNDLPITPGSFGMAKSAEFSTFYFIFYSVATFQAGEQLNSRSDDCSYTLMEEEDHSMWSR